MWSLFFIGLKMQRLFLALVILAVVHYGQTAMVATANIHIDSTPIGIGTVLFHQDSPQEPVRIAGIIDGLKPNTVHVSVCIVPNGIGKEMICLGLSCTQRSITGGKLCL